LKNKNSYQTLSEAIEDLQLQGYTENLSYCDTGLENKGRSCVYPASEILAKEFYRFEGRTNPGDNSILYAIETSDGHKGLLVDAYGAYSGNIPPEIVQKLRIDR
jgi:hypothetical protein